MPSGRLSLPVEIDRDWTREAACIGADYHVFFAEKSGQAAIQVAAAKAICARCPVRPECLAYALKNRIRHGVWGGTSEGEREQLRRQMRLTG